MRLKRRPNSGFRVWLIFFLKQPIIFIPLWKIGLWKNNLLLSNHSCQVNWSTMNLRRWWLAQRMGFLVKFSHVMFIFMFERSLARSNWVSSKNSLICLLPFTSIVFASFQYVLIFYSFPLIPGIFDETCLLLPRTFDSSRFSSLFELDS